MSEQHLDLDALADVLAGVAAPEHLDTCGPCRSRLAELAAAQPQVTALLAALPAPVEPPDLADRISRALAESARPTAPAEVLPLQPTRSRGTLWRVAGGVAAAAVLVVGGLLVLDRKDGGDHASTQASRRSWPVSATGTDYAAGAAPLRAALPQLLAGTAAPEVAGDATAGTTGSGAQTTLKSAPAVDPLARLRTSDGLAGCLTALSDAGQPAVPLALDYARYQGKPALVVVLPSSKEDKADVFVVGSGCSTADAKLLFFARLPKS